MFAVIETGGKQYKVQAGDVIYVEKLNAADNDTVEFPVVAVSVRRPRWALPMWKALRSPLRF